MTRHRVRFILVATLLAAVAGCGQKGPLYLPEDETPAQSSDAMPAVPAADTAADPQSAPVEPGSEESASPES